MNVRTVLTIAGAAPVLVALGWLLADLRRATQEPALVAIPSNVRRPPNASDRNLERLADRIERLERLQQSAPVSEAKGDSEGDDVPGITAGDQPTEPEDPADGGLSPLQARDLSVWQDSGYSAWSRSIEERLKSGLVADGSVRDVECRETGCRLQLAGGAEAEVHAAEEKIMQAELFHGMQLSYFWSGEGSERRRVIFVNAPGLPTRQPLTE